MQCYSQSFLSTAWLHIYLRIHMCGIFHWPSNRRYYRKRDAHAIANTHSSSSYLATTRWTNKRQLIYMSPSLSRWVLLYLDSPCAIDKRRLTSVEETIGFDIWSGVICRKRTNKQQSILSSRWLLLQPTNTRKIDSSSFRWCAGKGQQRKHDQFHFSYRFAAHCHTRNTQNFFSGAHKPNEMSDDKSYSHVICVLFFSFCFILLFINIGYIQYAVVLTNQIYLYI